MNPILSIVTGTYNRISHLMLMVNSARKSVGGLPYEIVVVDGGSTDGTLQWCERQKDIRLIKHGALHGAIRAFNDGCAHARGRYVVLANDDITFLRDTLVRAVVFMENDPDTGIGALYQDRSNQGWHVAEMPVLVDGVQKSKPYGQVCIVPKWLGDKLGWWSLEGARTYGGDNALSARAYEAGYEVKPVPRTFVHDVSADVQDELKRSNNSAVLPSGQHPDTDAYLRQWPKGPSVRKEKAFQPPSRKRSFRVLYAPIYEPGFDVQKEQKRGLREALAKIGLVYECDYLNGDSLYQHALAFKPDLIVTQLHDANNVTPEIARSVREVCPSAKWVNWHGDVWPAVLTNKDYIAVLKCVDVATVVNASLIEPLRQAGVKKIKYWQIGYEPDGVGWEPDDGTEKHDLVFLANNYSADRRATANFVASLPYNVGIYGGGWPEGFSRGQNLYNFREGCKVYRAAKFALSDSQWSDTARGFVSNRLFQAMAAGNCLVLQQRFDGMEDLLGLFSGVHLVSWDTHDDLKAKIAYYMEHEDERAKIARAGQAEVLKNHSFSARLRQLIDFLAEPEDRLIDPVYR